ncbi:hypothetical protein [Vibrio mytili]|uniref:hypothetical protein n=1 Tax=Vibrio mytili TaxID=50718 RepID=UPI000A65937F|nr:hypothetical protein [Vibrio mytili]EJG1872664.1 hypothetical protein [Vibrio parahaemolyticus]
MEERRGIVAVEQEDGTWSIIDTIHHQGIKTGLTQPEARELIEKLTMYALENL